MIRLFSALIVVTLFSSQAFAADDGGFGTKFTNKTPSALMEAPESTVAQSVPDASQVQNIMPASGDEDTAQPSAAGKTAVKPQGIVEAKPVEVHQSVESHVTVPASVDK